MAASKVNKTFVGVLVLAVLAIAAVVVVTTRTVIKSAEDHFKAGQEWEAQGEMTKAVASYAKAVNKDRGRLSYLKAWIGAQEKITPGSLLEYRDKFQSEYMPARRALALAQETDAEAQKPLLDHEFFVNSLMAADVLRWEQLINQTDEVIRRFPAGDKSVAGLRKYRGRARTMWVSESSVSPEDALTKAREDLEAAVAADPSDPRAMSWLGEWYQLSISRARQRREGELADKLSKEAQERLEGFIAANKVNLDVMWVVEQFNMLEVSRAGGAGAAMFAESMEKHRARAKRLIEQAISEPPEKIDRLMAGQVAKLTIAVNYPSALEEATKVIQHAMKSRPNDVLLMFTLGEIEMSANQYDRAIETLERLVNTPDMPMSVDGLMLFLFREDAMLRQAKSELAMYVDSKAPKQERDELLARAKQLREKIVDRFGLSPPVTYLDAQIRYVQGDMIEARRLLSTYTAQKPDDVQALRLMAEVLLKTQLTGEARATVEKLLQKNPSDVQAMVVLAQIHESLNQLKEASDWYARALILLPDNQAIKDKLERIRVVAQGIDSSDDIVRVLSQVEAKITGSPPDLPGALAMVRTLHTDLKAKGTLDSRAKLLIAQALVLLDDREGAGAIVATFSDQEKELPVVRALSMKIDNPDPLLGQIAAIDGSSLDDFFKAMFKYRAYRRAGKTAESKAQLELGRAKNPENALVLSAEFDEALAAGDLTEAKRIMEIATRLNTDRLGGAIFRIRVEAAEGRLASAAAMAQQLVDNDPTNPLGHRLVGSLRQQMGRYNEALGAFEQAVRIKPEDPENVKGKLLAMMAMGRMAEALQVAREAKRLVGNDSEFYLIMLNLEGEVGNADFAIEGWRRVHKQTPGDRDAAIQLANLLMRKEQWAEARQAIDAALAMEVDFTAMTLSAKWFASQGQTDKARQEWDRFIEKLPQNQRNAMLYVAYAEFLGNSGDFASARKLLEDHRNLQDPKQAEIDRELGDLFFKMGDFAAAAEALKRALATVEKDDLNRIRLRIIDATLRQRKFEEVIKLCEAAAAAGIQEDLQILVLRAEALAGLRDYEGQLAMLQRAVAKDRNSPLAFFKRAEFFMMQVERLRDRDGRVPADKFQQAQQMVKDAQDDLEACLRLESGFGPARRMLAQVMLALGTPAEASKLLSDGLIIDPRNSVLRRDLVTIYSAQGKLDEALKLIDEGEGLSNSADWPAMKGELLRAQGQWARSAEAFGSAWDKGAKTPEIARVYCEVLLQLQRPNIQRAMEVLAEPAIETPRWSALLTLRAKVNRMMGKVKESDDDIKAAFQAINMENTAAIAMFFQDVGEIFADKVPEMLAMIEGMRPPEGFNDLFQLQLIRFKLTVPALMAQALADLDQLVRTAKNPQAVQSTVRELANLMYLQGKYEAAVELYNRVLIIAPSDYNTMNNLAYTLSKHLGRHVEALPHAEKAAEALSDNSNVQDTLGVVQLALGRVPEAEKTLQKALTLANRPDQQVPALIHFAQVSLAKGDRPGAVDFLVRADREISRDMQLRARFGSEYDEVKRKVDGGR